MTSKCKYTILVCVGIALPFLSLAQSTDNGGLASGIQGLQVTLELIRHTMIQQCSQLIGIGRAIAGMGALWYIAYRVWGHIARAESIDFFPLLRPFAIGVAITCFPGVITAIDGLMWPTVVGTNALVANANQAVATLLQQREQAAENATDWQSLIAQPMDANAEQRQEIYGEEASPSTAEGITPGAKLQMSGSSWGLGSIIKKWLSDVLEVFFEAAALCINTVRIFYLVVLAIFGPLVFGLSVFDGLHHILSAWFARYLNVFLWLPICNVFGSLIGQIQQEMLKIDIQQLQDTGQTSFGATDVAYIVFLIMGIVGYFTVPSIAGWIINVGGHGKHLGMTGGLAAAGAGAAVAGADAALTGGAGAVLSGAGAIAPSVGGALGGMAGAPSALKAGYQEGGNSNGSSVASKAGRAYGQASNYMQDKLGGGRGN